jgi:hypothetical protein
MASTGLDWQDLLAKLLPLLLANLSPYITQGIHYLTGRFVGIIPAGFLQPLNMIIGSLAAGFAAAAGGGVPVDLAVGGGAVVSGVSWKLKQGQPVDGQKPPAGGTT